MGINTKTDSIAVLSKKWIKAHHFKKDPKFTKKDLDFLQDNLTEVERALFFQMDPVDQRHAYAVSKTVMEDPRIQTNDERLLLIKAALLHDIGKVKGDFTISQRVLVKLIKNFFPRIRQKMLKRRKTQGSLANAVFVQAIHPRRGAYMLETLGGSPLVTELVKNHHSIPTSRFERCLRDADSVN